MVVYLLFLGLFFVPFGIYIFALFEQKVKQYRRILM